MKIVKENLNEGQRLKPWHYTEDEIFDVAYNLMMNGYLEGWEAADIKSALLYADGETIGDAPYIFTMDEDDEDEYEFDDIEESFPKRPVKPSAFSYDMRFELVNDIESILRKLFDEDYISDYVDMNVYPESEGYTIQIAIADNGVDLKTLKSKIMDLAKIYSKSSFEFEDPQWDIAVYVPNENDTYDESLNENMDNMNRVLKSKVANPVTTFPITMTDAVEKNKEIEKQTEDIKKEQEKVFSNKRYFLGAQKQPTPKEVEEPKPLTLDERLFDVSEAVKRGTKLGKRKSTLPREREKREELDAWSTVMEELVPADILYKFKEVTKFPDIRPKARYDADSVSVDYDGNVEIYADDVKKFDFAKKVADAYNLKVDEPRPRTRGNGFTMKIHMPEAKDA